MPGTGACAPEVARAYVTELRDILRALDVSDVRMEQGSLRCDVNTSLNAPGAPWGIRTETKNVNSLRSVERAVRSEMIRQAAVLDAGHRVVQETRHFSETTGDTRPGRSKEEATDYRYFPEPDLVPLAPDPGWVERLRAELPELPAVHRARIRNRLGVSAEDMQQMANAGVVDLVAATVGAGAPAAEARNWWLGYLAQKANERDVEPADLAMTPTQVARIVELVSAGTLSVGLARQAVDGVLDTGEDVDAVVAAKGLRIVSDANALAVAADEAIAANPDIAEKVRSGKLAAVGPLVGAVMKATRGQADAAAVRELLLQRLVAAGRRWSPRTERQRRWKGRPCESRFRAPRGVSVGNQSSAGWVGEVVRRDVGEEVVHLLHLLLRGRCATVRVHLRHRVADLVEDLLRHRDRQPFADPRP